MQQESAGIGLGEFAILLDFEQSNEIVNSLSSKRFKMVKNDQE